MFQMTFPKNITVEIKCIFYFNLFYLFSGFYFHSYSKRIKDEDNSHLRCCSKFYLIYFMQTNDLFIINPLIP